MKLPEPVAWMLDGGVTIEMQFEPYHAGSEWEPLYTREQVKALLAQADSMLIAHMNGADQMRKRYESVLKQALEALEYANPLMECYWGNNASETIAAIKKVLG